MEFQQNSLKVKGPICTVNLHCSRSWLGTQEGASGCRTLANSAINSFQPCLMQWQTGTCRSTGSIHFLRGAYQLPSILLILLANFSLAHPHARAYLLSWSTPHCYTPCTSEQGSHLHNKMLWTNCCCLKMCQNNLGVAHHPTVYKPGYMYVIFMTCISKTNKAICKITLWVWNYGLKSIGLS